MPINLDQYENFIRKIKTNQTLIGNWRKGMPKLTRQEFYLIKGRSKSANVAMSIQISNRFLYGKTPNSLNFWDLDSHYSTNSQKNCIILLVLSICSYNAHSIQQAILTNYKLCHPDNSKESHRFLASQSFDNAVSTHGSCFTFMIQIARIQDYVTPNQQGMRVVSFVLHLLALIYIRNRITKLQKYYDERTTSLSDYSIIIKGLPLVKGIQKKLTELLKKQFSNPHQIKQITLLPKFKDIQILQKQKQQAINELRNFYEKQNVQDEQFYIKNKQLQQIQVKLLQAAKTARQSAQNDQMICQKIICVFNSEEQKEQILQQFKDMRKEKKELYFGENSSSIYMKQAPQPQQIIWRNANLSRKKRVLYNILGWSLSTIVLAITFAIFYFILQKKSLLLQQATKQLEKHPEDQKYQQQYRGALALVFILMFLIVIFDKLALATLFYKFTDLQRHSTTSKFQFSFALKLSLGLFFTTALMTLAVQAIRFHNYYLHAFGVIDEQTIMFFMNSFFVPFFWLVNPSRIKKQILRKLRHGKKSLTQQQANSLMQQQNYDMGKRFAEIIQMMWFTFLYSTLIPIGAVLTCCGLIFYYWVDKYNLLRRSSVKGQISGQIINTSLNLLDFTLILRPIGSIIFDSQIRTFYMNSNIIMIVVAFVYIVLPKDTIIQFLNDEKFRPQQKTYEEAEKNFHRTYHTEHPLFRIIHYDQHRSMMSSKGIVFNKSNKNIQNFNLPTETNEINSKMHIKSTQKINVTNEDIEQQSRMNIKGRNRILPEIQRTKL